jgi:hypothetical protein
MAVVQLVQQRSSTYRLDGASTLRIEESLPTFEDRVAFVQALFKLLSGDSKAA